MPAFERIKHLKIENPDFVIKKHVGTLDRDINMHANNIAYLRWVIDSIPSSEIQEEKISKININWSHEIMIGEDLDISFLKEKNADGSIVFFANIADRAYVKIFQEK